MNEMVIRIDDERSAFRPGESIAGEASWSLAETPDAVELRLFWHTSGKGDRDVGVAETVRFRGAGPSDRQRFELAVPNGPYSFSGKLITLMWALELVALPGEQAARVEIELSPTGQEIDLVGSREGGP